ncbi:Chromosome partition protein Smc [Carpediemonas membranifera]|uniref:Chromosome partition protein Smc n=1 Tax=Carpediemonas membranifera TaxID=201153 RepID=A0A8J6B3U9_9EUKA|nr:Chromosome partition protein Smc [Carpediemonas membranifera]|eukprot:KAG9392414.1 Chromosome partition protein Smc [Carpediemonas membranifera]
MNLPSHVVSLKASYTKQVRELTDMNYKLTNANEALERKVLELQLKCQKVQQQADLSERLLQMAEKSQAQGLTQSQRLRQTSELDRKEAKIAKLTEENARLVQEAEDMNQIMEQLYSGGVDDDTAQLRAELESTRVELGRAQDKITALEEALAASEEAKEDSASRAEGVEAVLESTLGEYETRMGAMRAEFDAELSDSRGQVEALHETIAGLEERVSRDMTDREAAVDEAARLRVEIEGFRKECLHRTSYTDQLEEIQAELLASLSRAQGQVDALEEDAMALQEERDQAVNKAAQAEQALQRARDEFEGRLEATRRGAETDKADTTAQLMTLRNTVAGLEKRLERETTMRERAEDELVTWRHRLEDASAAADTKAGQLGSKIEEVTKALEEAKQEIARHQEADGDAREQIEAETRRANRIAADSADKVAEVTRRAEKAENDLAGALVQVRILTEDQQSLRKRIESERRVHEGHVTALVEEIAGLRSGGVERSPARKPDVCQARSRVLEALERSQAYDSDGTKTTENAEAGDNV